MRIQEGRMTKKLTENEKKMAMIWSIIMIAVTKVSDSTASHSNNVTPRLFSLPQIRYYRRQSRDFSWQHGSGKTDVPKGTKLY